MPFTPIVVSNDVAGDSEPLPRSPMFPTLQDDVRAAMARPDFPPGMRLPESAQDSAALCLFRNWIADLQGAILNADLSDSGEFHALFSLMVGFGLSQKHLARQLGVEENTISRYANGVSCPSGVPNRRGILLETYRILQSMFNDGSLPVLSFYRKTAVSSA